MVCVAAVALGSSTYAWFANNNVVTADGISINAAAEGAMLVIADSADNLSKNQTTQTFDPEKVGKDLFPVHPIYTNTGAEVTAWHHAYSDDPNVAIKNSIEEDVTDDANGKYYLTTDLYIGLDNSISTASVGAISVSKVNLEYKTQSSETPNEDFVKSARVLMVVDNKVIGCFANGQSVTALGNESTADTLGTLSGTICNGLTAGKNVKVTLYIYFDGRDANCKSVNFDPAAISCSLEFTAASANSN